jgi:hypothetical protein
MLPFGSSSMATKIFKLTNQAGVKRDGTYFEGNYWNDAQHCRFQRGQPRKMGGYRQISHNFAGPVYAAHMSAYNGINSLHTGSASGVEVVQLDQNGFGAGIVSRTPAGYATNANALWQFDEMWDAAGSNMLLFAHPGSNLTSIDNAAQTPIYYGNVNSTAAMVAQGTSVSGGIMVLNPFLFTLDNLGNVAWSDENLPLSMTGGASGSARITSSKLVKGMAFRGGPTNSPSGLIWSLDSLIRVSYVGSPAIFKFDTVSDQTSILSSSSVIEYDGIFFWAGVDRFLMYNGVVREIPNQLNLNYFFDNLNYAQRQKVWAMKVPRFGEIWWFYPHGNVTECNRAVIFNVRENTWYDTALPRSSGHFPQVFHYPIMLDPTPDTNGKYAAWVHETGYDQVVGNTVSAIDSYVTSADISWCAQGPDQQQWMGQDNWVQLMRVEPDFNQTGDMTLTVSGHKYARSQPLTETPFTFGPTTEKIDMKVQERQLRLTFESNTVGGFYEMGQVVMTAGTGDGRQ